MNVPSTTRAERGGDVEASPAGAAWRLDHFLDVMIMMACA